MRAGNNKLGLLILFSLAPIASGQTAGPRASGTASVSGVVTNTVTGAPILRAHVRLQHFANGAQESYVALTNAEGKFALDHLPAGSYGITVEKTGFVASPDNDLNSPVELGASDKNDTLKLALIPGGSIAGRILDPEGEPVAECSVGLQSSEGVGVGGVQTDDRGTFRIGGLAPGKYRVVASPNQLPLPPEIRTDGTKEVHFGRTYFPGVLDSKSAQRVQVGPGAEVSGIEIHLVATPMISVSGKVTGIPDGSRAEVGLQEAAPGSDVTFGGGTFQQGLVKGDGSFHFWRLEPGRYSLSGAVPNQGGGFQNRLQSGPVEIQVAASDIEGIELRLMGPFDISGQVTADDAEILHPHFTGEEKHAPHRQIALRNVHIGGMPIQGEIADDDSFTLEKVLPGRYRVSVFWGPYVKSVRLGSNETEGDILDVSNGAAGPVTFTLSVQTGSISGTVSDANGPAAGAQVTLSAEMHPLETTMTDKDGKYQFESVQPGKYKIAAGDGDPENIVVRGGEKLTKDLTGR